MTIKFYYPTLELFCFSFTQPFTHSKFCLPNVPFSLHCQPQAAINTDPSMQFPYVNFFLCYCLQLRQMPNDREFDLTDPLRRSHSYNCLHDQHLQVYFRSNDIRKRMVDEGNGDVCLINVLFSPRQWTFNLITKILI